MILKQNSVYVTLFSDNCVLERDCNGGALRSHVQALKQEYCLHDVICSDGDGLNNLLCQSCHVHVPTSDGDIIYIIVIDTVTRHMCRHDGVVTQTHLQFHRNCLVGCRDESMCSMPPGSPC